MVRPTVYEPIFHQSLKALVTEGKSIREVHRVLQQQWPNVSFSTVRRYALSQMPISPKQGVKNKLNQRDVRLLKRKVLKSELCSSKEMAAWVQSDLGRQVSRRTICRVIKDEKLHFRKARKIPLLTAAQKVKRLDWANNFKTTYGNLELLLVSDEKRWNLNGPDGASKAWDDDLHRKVRTTVKFQCASVYAWACFGVNYCSELHIHKEGHCDGMDYISVLKKEKDNHAFDGGRILLQDGATWHTSALVKNWVANNGLAVHTIPPNSPDLNPIENVWGTITNRLYKGGRRFANKDSLIAALKAEWRIFQEDVFMRRTLIEDMTDRVAAVQQSKGAWPKNA